MSIDLMLRALRKCSDSRERVHWRFRFGHDPIVADREILADKLHAKILERFEKLALKAMEWMPSTLTHEERIKYFEERMK